VVLGVLPGGHCEATCTRRLAKASNEAFFNEAIVLSKEQQEGMTLVLAMF
jgi:hypothetical protein